MEFLIHKGFLWGFPLEIKAFRKDFLYKMKLLVRISCESLRYQKKQRTRDNEKEGYRFVSFASLVFFVFFGFYHGFLVVSIFWPDSQPARHVARAFF